MIAVVGGCYAERCASPTWNYIYGSAGRAAAAISSRCTVELYTLIGKDLKADFLFTMSSLDIEHRFVSQDHSITFEYLHPLSSPFVIQTEQPPEPGALPHIRNENILYFGMMEYTPIVHGERVVYDPQGAKSKLFSDTGSTAKELIYVLNEFELAEKTGNLALEDAGHALLRSEHAAAVVVKRGPLGAAVFLKGEPNHKIIPCYRARRVFKIGSGDLFAASFAYFWAIEGETIETAADLASRATCCYVETRDASIPTKEELLRDYSQEAPSYPGRIYLAAPFFCLEQRWLLEETKQLLELFGCAVFSPLHEVGTGRSNDEIATEDLRGLDECDAILALMNDNDPGTIFEIGYAIAKMKPVVVYAERNSARDLTMLDGTKCKIFPDYCTAIYNAVWESCSK